MPEPIYIVKGPEQLVVEDIVPTVSDYLVVESITFVEPPEHLGENGVNLVPAGFRVGFTDGTFTVYPIGSAIRVAE